jgi:hypothetical protein
MSKKKIKVYGILGEGLTSKIKDKVGVITSIFEDLEVTHCVLTFDKDMIVYAALCDENTISVCVEKGVKK